MIICSLSIIQLRLDHFSKTAVVHKTSKGNIFNTQTNNANSLLEFYSFQNANFKKLRLIKEQVICKYNYS